MQGQLPPARGHHHILRLPRGHLCVTVQFLSMLKAQVNHVPTLNCDTRCLVSALRYQFPSSKGLFHLREFKRHVFPSLNWFLGAQSLFWQILSLLEGLLCESPS